MGIFQHSIRCCALTSLAQTRSTPRCRKQRKRLVHLEAPSKGQPRAGLFLHAMGQRASRTSIPEAAPGAAFGSSLCVIIPVLNEEAHIQAAILSVTSGTCAVCQPEVVVVDGGSSDATVQRARAVGPGVKVLHSPPGRGIQMNRGWRETDRPWCLFLHGDSQLPPNYLQAMQAALLPSGGGATSAVDAEGLQGQGAGQGQRQGYSQPLLGAGQEGLQGQAQAWPALQPAQRGGPLQGSWQDDSMQGMGQAWPAVQPGHRRVGRRRPASQRPATACGAWCRCAQHTGGQQGEGTGTSGRQGGSGPACGCTQPLSLASPQQQQQPAQQGIGFVGQGRSGLGWWWPWGSHGSSSGGNGGGGSAASGAVGALAGGPQRLWGCFQTIETEWRDSWRGVVLSKGVEWRTRVAGWPYGDQAIFASRDLLEKVGGLPEWPLLEDSGLVQRLRRAGGPPAILPLAVRTSGRRWDRLGFWRTCLFNQVILLAWTVGVPPSVLAGWYYGARQAAGSRSRDVSSITPVK